MGCGSSSLDAAGVVVGAGPTPGHHPNTSLVLGSDGTASARARRLKERPKTGSQAIEGEAMRSIKEQSMAERRRRKEEATAMDQMAAELMRAATSAAAGGNVNPLSPPLDGEPITPGDIPATATDEGEGDSSGSDEDEEESGEDDDDDEDDDPDSMEEIEEEPGEPPLDDGGGVMSPVAGVRAPATLAPSARPHNLQRGNSMHKLVKTFAPENVHILVVDDDVVHMEVVAQWLAHKRYHVTLCNDGEEAVEVLSATFANRSPRLNEGEDAADDPGAADTAATAATTDMTDSPFEPQPEDHHHPPQPTEDFDLILSDLSMETPDGIPLLDWVLKHDQTKHIPFVLMSSDFTTQSCDRTLRRGAEDFLQRPLQRGLLLKTLRTILEQRLEQRNTRALKEWGDTYKKQLLAEKKSKDSQAATACVRLLLPHSLGTYVSVDGLSTPEGTSPSAKRVGGGGDSAPGSAEKGDPPPSAFLSLEDGASNEQLPLRPHPELITQPSRKQLHVHVPYPNEGATGGGGGGGHPAFLSTPQFSAHGGSFLSTPQLFAQHGLPPTNWMLSGGGMMAGGFAMTPSGSAGPAGSPLPDESPQDERAVVEQATVLLVDPSDGTRETLGKWLASIQYTLLTQPTMEDALEFLRRSALPRNSTVLQRSATHVPTLGGGEGAGGGVDEKSHLNRLISIDEPSSDLLPPMAPHSAKVQGARADGMFAAAMDQHHPHTTRAATSTTAAAAVAAPARSITHMGPTAVGGAGGRKGSCGSMKPPLAIGSKSTLDLGSSSSSALMAAESTPAFGSRKWTVGAAPPPSRPANHVDLIIADADPWEEAHRTPPPPPPAEDGGDIAATATPPASSLSQLTGAAFMHAIQGGASTKSIPVMLIYSNASSVDATEAIRAGVETILAKPISKDLLLKKVNQVLTSIAQKKKSELYAERAQAYRTILTSFRQQREEQVRQGKRTPKTPMRKRSEAVAGTTHATSKDGLLEDVSGRAKKPMVPSSRALEATHASDPAVAVAAPATGREAGGADGPSAAAAPAGSLQPAAPSGLAQPVQKRSSSTFTFDVLAATRARAEFDLVATAHAAEAAIAVAAPADATSPAIPASQSQQQIRSASPLPPSAANLQAITSTPPRTHSSSGSSSSLPPISIAGRSSPNLKMNGELTAPAAVASSSSSAPGSSVSLPSLVRSSSPSPATAAAATGSTLIIERRPSQPDPAVPSTALHHPHPPPAGPPAASASSAAASPVEGGRSSVHRIHLRSSNGLTAINASAAPTNLQPHPPAQPQPQQQAHRSASPTVVIARVPSVPGGTAGSGSTPSSDGAPPTGAVLDLVASPGSLSGSGSLSGDGTNSLSRKGSTRIKFNILHNGGATTPTVAVAATPTTPNTAMTI